MANPISSTLGTQRQFSKQPERPYQKSLIAPSFGSGINYGVNGNLQALASSLGLFGKGLLAESIARDKRAEKIGEAEASRLFAVTSEQDKEKLGTLDILGRSEKFDLADNPYAIARIDELRGQHLNTLYKNEYDLEVFPNQELPQTSQENIQRYEDFMDEKVKEYDGVITNKTAFAKGFYGSRPVDVLSQDAKYRKQRQANLEADRNASIGTKMSDIVAHSINAPIETTVAALQDAQTDGMLSALSLTDRIKLAETTGKGLAANGNPELITAWGDTIVYYSQEGQPVRVKDVIPLDAYVDRANKANVSLYEQKTRDWMTKISNTPLAALPELCDNLKAQDPSFWKALSGGDAFKKAIKTKQSEEKAKIKAESKLAEAQSIKAVANATLKDRYASWQAGKTLDSTSHAISSKEFVYDGKNKNIDELEINTFGQAVLANIMNDDSLTDYQKAEETLKALSFPLFKGTFVTAMEKQYSNVLGSLSVKGDVLSDKATKMLNMYHVDPALFQSIFSDKLTKDVNTLSTIMDLTDGSVAAASDIYVKYKEAEADPVRMDEYRKGAKEAVGSVTLDSLGTNGSTNTVNITDDYNPAVSKAWRMSYITARACGMNESDAAERANSDIQNYYMEYEGCAFNKSFTYNIVSPFKEEEAKAFLDMKKAQYGGDGVHFMCDASGYLCMFIGRSCKERYNKATFAEEVNKWIMTRDTEPPKNEGFLQKLANYFMGTNSNERVTLDDIEVKDPSTDYEHLLDDVR